MILIYCLLAAIASKFPVRKCCRFQVIRIDPQEDLLELLKLIITRRENIRKDKKEKIRKFCMVLFEVREFGNTQSTHSGSTSNCSLGL